MTRKIAVAIVLIILIISGLATATFFFTSENGWFPSIIESEPKFNYLSGGTLIPGKYLKPAYNKVTGDWRPYYEGMTDKQYKTIFKDLPSFPEDFYSIIELIYNGLILDYARIAEKYWKQPEFYVGWYGCINDSYIRNDPSMWTPEGYGVFPLIKEVKLKRGGTYYIDAYLRTGFGVEAYQGIIFRPTLPESAKSITGEVLFSQPENAEQYIHPKITNEDDPLYLGFIDDIDYTNVGENDWFVILKPTYQLLKTKDGNISETGFPADWVQLMDIEITIDVGCPPGIYVVAVESDTPCFEINQEFYYSQDHEYYGGLYFPAGRFHKSNKPHFQIVIEVI